MSSLFYPSRHHHRYQPYGYSSSRGLSPYYGHSGPVSLSNSPWASSDPFNFALDRPFHQPFLSLFNDTFSQLDHLSNELNGYLNGAFGNQNAQDGNGKNAIAWAPKFDIKETDDAYVLEGEMPGMERKNVSVEWAGNNTMLVKGKTETYREEGEKPTSATTEASGITPAAEADATKDTSTPASTSAVTDSVDTTAETNKDTAMTTTDTKKDVTKHAQAQPTYHLTERTVGTFQRVFSFPGEVHHDNVKASLKNGLLTVTVPKVVKDTAETKKARTVEVEEVKDEADAVKDADKMQA